MKNKKAIKQMVGLASLAAIIVVLQLIAGFLPKLPGGLSISLVLVPIIIGAILYGFKGGAFLGLVFAVMVLIDPSTAAFYEANIFATIVLVILKGVAAGAISGLLFTLLYKKNFFVAVVVASIIAPIINTGIFCLGAAMFYRDLFGGGLFVIIGIVGANFLVELGINTVLCPAIATLIKVTLSNYDLGTTLDKNSVIKEELDEE